MSLLLFFNITQQLIIFWFWWSRHLSQTAGVLGYKILGTPSASPQPPSRHPCASNSFTILHWPVFKLSQSLDFQETCPLTFDLLVEDTELVWPPPTQPFMAEAYINICNAAHWIRRCGSSGLFSTQSLAAGIRAEPILAPTISKKHICKL